MEVKVCVYARSLYSILKAQGIRLVFAQVMDVTEAESRYDLKSLVGEDTFYTNLGEVIDDCRKKTT